MKTLNVRKVVGKLALEACLFGLGTAVVTAMASALYDVVQAVA